MFELEARYVDEGKECSNQLGDETRVIHWELTAQPN